MYFLARIKNNFLKQVTELDSWDKVESHLKILLKSNEIEVCQEKMEVFKQTKLYEVGEFVFQAWEENKSPRLEVPWN